METNEDEGLSKALATLNELIEQMHGFELHETAQFLAMAKLHLLMDINGITGDELRALSAAVEREIDAGAGRAERAHASPERRARTTTAADGAARHSSPRTPDRLAALRASRAKR